MADDNESGDDDDDDDNKISDTRVLLLHIFTVIANFHPSGPFFNALLSDSMRASDWSLLLAVKLLKFAHSLRLRQDTVTAHNSTERREEEEQQEHRERDEEQADEWRPYQLTYNDRLLY